MREIEFGIKVIFGPGKYLMTTYNNINTGCSTIGGMKENERFLG